MVRLKNWYYKGGAEKSLKILNYSILTYLVYRTNYYKFQADWRESESRGIMVGL